MTLAKWAAWPPAWHQARQHCDRQLRGKSNGQDLLSTQAATTEAAPSTSSSKRVNVHCLLVREKSIQRYAHQWVAADRGATCMHFCRQSAATRQVSPSCKRVTRAVFPLPIAEGSARLVKLAWLGVHVPSSCSQRRELRQHHGGRIAGGPFAILLQAVLGAAVQAWCCAHARSRHPAASTWLAGTALSGTPAQWPFLHVLSADKPVLPYQPARIPYNIGYHALQSQQPLGCRRRRSHLLPGTAWPVAKAVAVFSFPVAQVQLHGGPSVPDAQRSKGPCPHILQAHFTVSTGSSKVPISGTELLST